MRTLFPSSYNWGIFILTAMIIRVTFVDMSLLSFVAILISLYQFSLLFISIGNIIPTRHLLGTFMCVQFFIGPVLAYNGFDQYQYFRYRMRIPEADYFAYVIPAIVFFILGLHLNAGKYRGEVVNRKAIERYVEENPMLPYLFIVLGFSASVISTFFASDLAFVFYLLGSFKFIGLFILVLGTRQLKLWAMVLVIGSIVSSSLGSGMFHDLLTWVVYAAAVFGIKYKFSFNVKMLGLAGFFSIALLIQILKGGYRQELEQDNQDAGIATFSRIYEEKQNQKQGVFSIENLATSSIRINQGFIITNIMTTVPDIVPFADGSEMYKILEAAILPRILAPNKLRAGDREIFRKYSRIGIQEGTSMGLSSVGDAYINFGVFGGIIFMLALGLLYSEILNSFQKNSFTYPILILFVPLSFYYPIRPDCELQTILGHLFKSIILIFGIIQIWRYKFMLRPLSREKSVPNLSGVVNS